MDPARDADVVGPVEAFWRYRYLTLPVCALLVLAGALYGLANSGSATATTTIYLTDPRGVPVFRDGSSAPADLATYTLQRARFARSSDVLGEVAKVVPNDESIDSLRKIVSTVGDASSGVRVSCTDDDGEHAREICTRVTKVYQKLSREETQRRADSVVKALNEARASLAGADEPSSTAIDTLDLKVADTESTAALFGSGVEFVEATKVTTSSQALPAIQYGVAGLLLGAFLSVAASWTIAARRPLVRDGEQAALGLGAPFLGHISSSGLGFDVDTVATNLGPDASRGLVAVTSLMASRAKAEAAASLGSAWAREGHRVLLLEADSGGGLPARFEVTGEGATLADLLSTSAELRDFGEVDVDGQLVAYVPAGPMVDHEASLIRSARAQVVLAEIRKNYDVTILDAAPVLSDASGAAVASAADGLVVLVPEGVRQSELDRLRRRVEVMRTPVLGVIFETDRR